MPTRRAVLVGGTTLPMVARAQAQDTALNSAINAEIGDRTPVDGGITVRLPRLAENGAQVPMTVIVDNPMSASAHVTAIHVFATRNPTPHVASFRLTPASDGRRSRPGSGWREPRI